MMRDNGSRLLKYVGVLLAIFMAGGVFAQGNSTASASGGTSVTKNKKSPKSSEDFNAQLSADLTAISYMEESGVDQTFQQRAQIELKTKKEGSFFSESHLILGSFSAPGSMYYAFPQGYVGFGDKEGNLTIGRKHENLSFVDSVFHMGLMQSNFTSDFINFEEGGLTGMAAHFSTGNFGGSASFNPIFIPNQGPEKKTENGRIVTTNRWTPQAPSKFKFGDQYKDINYAIRDYKISEIIAHGGYMLNAYIGKNNIRPVLRVSYGKKPINEIAHMRDTYSDISNLEGYVFLTPVVLNHEIQAADLNLDYQNFQSTLSYLTDQPENQAAADGEIIQTLSPVQVVSLYASVDLTRMMGKKMQIYAAAASITGGGIKDLSSEGKESTFAVAGTRTQYKKPVKVGLKGELFFIYNEALEADTSLIYDQEYKGSLLSVNFKYAPMKNLKVNMGADLLGVENDLPEDAQGNFLDQNKANDRVFAGVNYAF